MKTVCFILVFASLSSLLQGMQSKNFLFGLPGFRLKDQAPNCNGNACNVISINPQRTGGFTIRNISARKVKITIRFAIGLGCQGPTDIHIGPRNSKNYLNGGYCNPYSANYE